MTGYREALGIGLVHMDLAIHFLGPLRHLSLRLVPTG